MATAEDVLKKYGVDPKAEDILAKYGIDKEQSKPTGGNELMKTLFPAFSGMRNVSDIPKDSPERQQVIPELEKYRQGQREGSITGAELGTGFIPGVSSLVMGGGEGLRAGLQGKSAPEIMKKALFAASLDAALGGVGKYARFAKKIPKVGGITEKALAGGVGGMATALASGVAKMGLQTAKRVPSWVMNRVLRNVDILKTPQPLPLDAAESVVKAAKALKNQASDVYGEGLDQIKAPITKKAQQAIEKINAWKIANQKTVMSYKEMAALSRKNEGMKTALKELNSLTVKPRGIPVIIKNESLNPEKMASLVKRQLDSLGKNYSDEVVDSFFEGKRLSFDDAKNINRALADTIKSYRGDPSKAVLVRSLTKLKESNMKSLEKIGPGLRDLNRQYAIDKDLSQRALETVTSKNPEAKIEALAKQLASGKGTKTLDVRTIEELEKRLNVQLKDNLADSIARKEFEKAVDNVMVGYGTPQAMLGLGLGLKLGSSGGPLGMGLGGLVGWGMGMKAGHYLEPERVAWMIENAPKIPKALRYLTTPARTGVGIGSTGLIGND